MLNTRTLLWTCCWVGCLAAFCGRPSTLYAKAPAETLEVLRARAAENEKAARLIRLLGPEVATPADARKMLQLRGTQ